MSAMSETSKPSARMFAMIDGGLGSAPSMSTCPGGEVISAGSAEETP